MSSSEASRDTLTRQVLATTVAGYLVQPLMFFSNLLVRRELGPYLTGVVATLTIVQTYTQLCSIGVVQAAERELPVLRGAGQQERFDAVRTTAFLVAFVAGLIVGLGMVGYAFFARATLDPALFRGLLAYAAMVVLTQWANAQLALLRANLQFTFLARFSVMNAFLAALLNIGGVFVAGFDGVLIATLLVALSTVVAYSRVGGLPPLKHALTLGRTQLGVDARALLLAGLPLIVMASVHSILHTIDNVMTLRLLGTEWLGRYTLALSAGAVLYSFSNSVTTVLFPHMQVAFGKDKSPAAFGPFVEKPMRMLAAGLPLLIAPLFWGLPVLARGILPKFIPGIPAFKVLIVGIVFYALAQLPHLALYSMNKIGVLVGWTLAVAGVAVVATVGLTELGLGLVGVALGVSLAYLVFFTGLAAFALTQWASRAAVLRSIGRTVFFVAVAAALFAFVDRLPMPEPAGFWSDTSIGCLRIVLFLGAYVPFLRMVDGETGLLREQLYPALRRMGRLRAKG